MGVLAIKSQCNLLTFSHIIDSVTLFTRILFIQIRGNYAPFIKFPNTLLATTAAFSVFLFFVNVQIVNLGIRYSLARIPTNTQPSLIFINSYFR